jgi:hypothetical protein
VIAEALKWIAEQQWRPSIVSDPGRPDMRIVADRQGKLSSFLATEERSVRLEQIVDAPDWIEHGAQVGLNMRAYVSSRFVRMIGELRSGSQIMGDEDDIVPPGSVVFRETAIVEIPWSQPLRELLSLQVAPGCEAIRMSASGFVDFLSRRLCRGVPREAIAPFRRIDFARLQKTQTVSERGNESLGRSIEATVQGVESLPDSVFATIPLLAEADGPTMTFRIRVDIDAAGGALIPSIDEAEVVMAMVSIRHYAANEIKMALPEIRKRIGQEELEVPVLFGDLTALPPALLLHSNDLRKR